MPRSTPRNLPSHLSGSTKSGAWLQVGLGLLYVATLLTWTSAWGYFAAAAPLLLGADHGEEHGESASAEDDAGSTADETVERDCDVAR